MNSEMLGRITLYYRILNRLRALGLEKVFAHNLADGAGVSAAIVRKDFSILEIYGQKRGGYEIEALLKSLAEILGKSDSLQNVIIVGCGRIGKALMHYTGFENDGIRIVAGFDSNPLIYNGENNPIKIYPLSELERIIKKHSVKVAILSVPESSSADVYKRLIDAGISGILNFSPITLKPLKTENSLLPTIHNVNIALELEQIFYQLQTAKK
ncbi:MAG: redox-sensing transcriptional repressor Rex [Sphaerochaetaceae bacterium]